MTSYKPPWSLPTTDGTDVGGPSMQTPPSMQFTIDASQKWFDQMGPVASQVGDQIVNHYSSNLSQFVQSRRQQNALGGLAQSARTMTLPGIDITHINNQGLETIRIIVRPENAPAEAVLISTDINLDGYVAWVHHWVRFPPPTIDNSSIDIILNGYGIFTGYTPDDDLFQNFSAAQDPSPPAAQHVGATVIFVMAFGDTALRCPSLQDDLQGKNPFTLTNGSGGPTAKVIPPRPEVKANGLVPAHKDDLGYFVFNWGDQFNPDTWAFQGNAGGTGPDFSYDKNFPPAVILKIIQFKTPGDSPLAPLGPNAVYSQQATYPDNFGQNGVDFLCAEFYNRSSLRPVLQSWKFTVNSPSAILLANDKPLYFACDGGNPFGDIGAHRNIGMNFDLSSVPAPADAATFGVCPTFANLFFQPLTEAEIAVLAINTAGEAAHAAAFNAALATLSTAQVNLTTANDAIITPSRGSQVTAAYAYAENPTPTNLAALVLVEPDPVVRAALIVYCQASLAYQLNPSDARRADFIAAESANVTVAGLVEGDFLGILSNQAAFLYSTAYFTAYNATFAAGGSVAAATAAGNAALASALVGFNSTETNLAAYATAHGEPTLAAAVTAALAAVISAENAFIAVQALWNPSHIKANNYKPIDAFNFRTITVVNGVYSIGPYSKG